VVDLCDEVSEVRTERICNVQDLDEVEVLSPRSYFDTND
jgi:hypothetical protein